MDGAILLHVDDAGARYPIAVDPLVWSEVKKLMATDAEEDDLFGYVAFSGDTVVIGAPQEDAGGSDAGAAYVFKLALDLGDPCTDPSDCASGFCVDGVCCDDACGGDVTTDCRACSVAAGASTDGVCEDLTTGTTCDDGFFCTATDTDSDTDTDTDTDSDGGMGGSDSSGCGCRVAGPVGSGAGLLGLLIAIIL